MRKLLLAALATGLLLSGSGARALPPIGSPIGPIGPIDCFDDPQGCELDPTDPCIENPGLCEPPPDPCIENPELCEPDPTDPCELTSCPEDPPAADPGDALPYELTGTARVKAGGQKSAEPYSLALAFDTSALSFLAMDGAGALYGGNLVPKGKKGTKFQLFLDGPSEDALSADIAGRGAAVSGRTAGSVLGQSGKLILKLQPGGGLSLQIKRQVLVGGVGEVVFKANLAMEAPPAN